MVMDALVTGLTAGKQTYDRSGKFAAKAHVNRKLLDELLRDQYYRREPPKTAGREQYGREFVERMRASGVTTEDLIATATALTAATIAMGIAQFTGEAKDLIVSGGGVHNRQLMGNLAALVPGLKMSTSNELGIHADAKEAVAFAVLAYRTWHDKTGNVPSATGAGRAVVLGSITRA